MANIAIATDSWIDLNGNGSPDGNEWMVYSSGSYNIVDQVLEAVSEFTIAVTYDLEMSTDDPANVIVSVNPIAYYNVPAQGIVEFELTLQPTPLEASTIFSDTVYVVPTQILGDGEIVLWEGDLTFLIPGPTPLP
jgi:hypothetical protein